MRVFSRVKLSIGKCLPVVRIVEKEPLDTATQISSDNVWSAAGLQGKSYGARDKSAAMYSAFRWRTSLLAMMSSAACLSLQVGRSLKTIIGIRLKARRCDCSFVFAVLCRLRWVSSNPLMWGRYLHRRVHAAEMLGSGL
jgi:hypothetical protein